jgi:hypothetical protein
MRSTYVDRPLAVLLSFLLVACGDLTGGGSSQPVPSRIVLSQPALSLDDESAAELTAGILDQRGNAIVQPPAGFALSWTSGDSAVAHVRNGMVQALRPGSTFIRVSAGALSDSARVTVRPVAAQLVATGGTDQRGSALEVLRNDVAVRALDRHGSPVPGANVAFTVVAGDGTLSAAIAAADSLGVARVRWTLGPRTGPQQVRASLAGTRTAEVVIAATAQPQVLLSRHAVSIELMYMDTGSRRQLLPQWVATNPTWSPDGRRIAFVGRPWDSMDTDGIYVMNADGTGATRIAGSSAAGDRTVDWSPDGNRLVFSRMEGGAERIFVINRDGTGLTQLTSLPSKNPRWSPDGSKIAFSVRSASHESYEIAVMNADGTGVRHLTSNQTDDEEPSWSPDGSRLAYHGWRLGRSRIFVIHVDGSGDRLLNMAAPANLLYDKSPAWSPDGGTIAFSRSTSVTTPTGASVYIGAVYTVQLDGTALRMVTDNRDETLVRPRWRP